MELRGIMKDGKTDFAIFSTDTGGRVILRGKRLGFALADIKELLGLYDVDPDHLEQMRATLAKGRARMDELERQREEIALTLQELRQIEAHLVDCIAQKEAAARSGGRKGTPS